MGSGCTWMPMAPLRCVRSRPPASRRDPRHCSPARSRHPFWPLPIRIPSPPPPPHLRLPAAEATPLLAALGGAAEDAVFALQELARGISPGVLADQGLIAALRMLAGRLPLSACVQVEPILVGRRFDRELEVALYFVALEAMTNVQKRANTANLMVSLRSPAAGRTVVLEVHDDGPGFDRWSVVGGSGLQNMQDRIAAVGGTVLIESRPGAGTWVRAEVRCFRTRAGSPAGRQARRRPGGSDRPRRPARAS